MTSRLYSNNTCSTQVGTDQPVSFVFDSPVATSTTGHAETVTGFAVPSGTYYWRVTFSGNNYNSSFITDCRTESTSVTIVNQ